VQEEIKQMSSLPILNFSAAQQPVMNATENQTANIWSTIDRRNKSMDTNHHRQNFASAIHSIQIDFQISPTKTEHLEFQPESSQSSNSILQKIGKGKKKKKKKKRQRSFSV